MNLDKKLFKHGMLFGILIVMVLAAACSPANAPSQNSSQKNESFEIKPAAGSGKQGRARVNSPSVTDVSNLEIQAVSTAVEEIQSAEAELQSTPQMSAVEPQEDSSASTADPEAPSQAGQPGQNEGQDAGPLPPVDPTIGNLAPDFTLTTLDGKSVSLSELRGRPVVLNYWVTWCIPCRDEMPAIESLQSQYQAEGLVILSINGTKQDVLGDVEKFVGDLGLTFPVLLDQSEEVYNAYRVLFMPTSFFIDQRGVIQDVLLGSTTEEGFQTRVEKIVNGIN
jgi:peroxiredoxin